MKFPKNILAPCAAALLLATTAAPHAPARQDRRKPPAEWSEKEAQKLLEDSPWAQTQTFSDTSRMFDRDTTLASGQSRVVNVFHVNLRVRFLSAQPVRQAVARAVELRQKGKLAPDLAARLSAFAASDAATAFPDYIVVTVTADSEQANTHLRDAQALLDRRTTAELKLNTFLELKNGKRLFLHEYQPPRNDGLGARFIFPRNVDGQPFITPDAGEVRFYSELTGRHQQVRAGALVYTIDTRYKVADMIHNGKLEY